MPFEDLVRDGEYRFHPLTKKIAVFGFLHSRWFPEFTLCFRIHDGFLDSRWISVPCHTESFCEGSSRSMPKKSRAVPSVPCQVFRAVNVTGGAGRLVLGSYMVCSRLLFVFGELPIWISGSLHTVTFIGYR